MEKQRVGNADGLQRGDEQGAGECGRVRGGGGRRTQSLPAIFLHSTHTHIYKSFAYNPKTSRRQAVVLPMVQKAPLKAECGADAEPRGASAGSADAEQNLPTRKESLQIKNLLPHSASRPPLLPAFLISGPDHLPFLVPCDRDEESTNYRCSVTCMVFGGGNGSDFRWWHSGTHERGPW
jgi:hypothetical protein